VAGSAEFGVGYKGAPKMYAEISAAISSARTALDIAKTAQSLSNFNELVAAISEVNTKLMDATAIALASQEKQSALTSRVADLENQLREIENWETQIKRYKLHEVPATKALAYALQPGMENDEPVHYLCTTCMNKREKTILHPRGRILHCPICNINIETQPSSATHRQSSSDSWRI
jgi:hypothetical protein